MVALLSVGCLSTPDVEHPDLGACSNGALDEGETDIDCGGPLCDRCSAGASCMSGGDCETTFCKVGAGRSMCVSHCDNEQLDLDLHETDVDCGGSCAGCSAGNACALDTDCLNGPCIPTIVHADHAEGRCWAPSFSGCALVAYDTLVVADICGSLMLAVCQVTANSQMAMHCVQPKMNPTTWDANFLCCPPSMF